MNLFETARMTLEHSNGTVVARDLTCQLDTVNIPLNMEGQGLIPTDWFDLFSLGWTSPIPGRGDYFVDQATGTKYSVFGEPGVYFDHIECRLTKYAGTTP